MSLEKLLESLGFSQSITFTSTFIIPSISLIGIIVCSLSVYIFLQPRFINPVYYFYRLLCVVYIVHLMHGIPFGLLFSPKYFPQIDTYLSSIYLIYNGFMTAFLYHSEDMIKMMILLDRMKIFTPFLMRHFTTSMPRFISLTILFACFCINIPIVLGLEIKSFGTYSYTTGLEHDLEKNATFYFFDSSEFSSTRFGKSLLSISSLFLNYLLTLVLGLTLNIVSIYKYKSFLRERAKEAEEEKEMTNLNSVEIKQMGIRERNKLQNEKNMFYMALTLCSISFFSRMFFIFAFVYFFYFNTFHSSLNLALIIYLIHALESILNIFVFYSFNEIFNDEFKRKILFRLTRSNLDTSNSDFN